MSDNHRAGQGGPRRSRRIAGKPAEATTSSASAFTRPLGTQSHPPPPSGDFTFVRSDPPVPGPGFVPQHLNPGSPILLLKTVMERQNHSSTGMIHVHDPAGILVSSAPSTTLPRPLASHPPVDPMDIDSIDSIFSRPTFLNGGQGHGQSVDRAGNIDLASFTRAPGAAFSPQWHPGHLFASWDRPQSSTAAGLQPPNTYSGQLSRTIFPPLTASATPSVAVNTTFATPAFAWASPVLRTSQEERSPIALDGSTPVPALTPQGQAAVAIPAVAANPAKPLLKKHCIICGEEGCALIKPCQKCKCDYCSECVKDMFVEALTDNSRMPPKCCAIIQLHVGLPLLTEQQGKTFRERFEEWMTTDKVYCPVGRCSAFISERLFQTPKAPPPTTFETIFLQELHNLYKNINRNANADVIRLAFDPSTPNPNHLKLKTEMSVNIVGSRISFHKTIGEFLRDLDIMVENARVLNTPKAPVSTAAENLRTYAYKQINSMPVVLGKAAAQSQAGPSPMVACPKCFIAICTTCKQIVHSGKPCDTSAHDYEMAMLATFNYKRCPKCKTAIKRMFGCPHMACLCGAHWCWYCQRPTTECDGGCDPGSEEEDEEEGHGTEIVEDEQGEALMAGDGSVVADVGIGNDTATVAPVAAVPDSQTLFHAATEEARRGLDAEVLPAPPRFVDLDAGGAARWVDAGDFGDEPSDHVRDVWACTHVLHVPRQHELEVHGVPHMDAECNKCFRKVKGLAFTSRWDRTALPESRSREGPSLTTQSSNGTARSTTATGHPARRSENIEAYFVRQERRPRNPRSEETAWECKRCCLIICGECRSSLTVDSDDED